MNLGRRGKEFLSSSSDDDDESPFLKKRESQDTKMWDIFEDPPAKKTTGSAETTRNMDIFLKAAKIFTSLATLAIVVSGAVVSKLSLIFMTSQLSIRNVSYCDDMVDNYTYHQTSRMAEIDDSERLAWLWAIVFAFSFPELLTFFRAFRICFFKNVDPPTLVQHLCVSLFEILHAIGLAILCFAILPELDAVKGIMLTSCFCFIPAVLDFYHSKREFNFKSIARDTLPITAQITGFVVWPLLSDNNRLYLIPLAAYLISFRWWENYIPENSKNVLVQFFGDVKKNLTKSRYLIYLYLSPLKVIVFLITAILCSLDKRAFTDHFTSFADQWESHNVTIYPPNYNSGDGPITTDPVFIRYILIIQILCGYATYLAARFACKIKIVTIGFSTPLILTIPICIAVLQLVVELRYDNVCAFHGSLPDYLFFNVNPPDQDFTYLWKNCGWIWILWYLSQIWITRHIWAANFNIGESTDILFVLPSYNGLIIDQSLTMNYRKDNLPRSASIKEESKQADGDSDIDNSIDAIAGKSTQAQNDVIDHDKVPQVFICATMWHETKDEMMEFLKSILRMDSDHSARRLNRVYFKNFDDKDYYDLETHIFFDDAFMENKSQGDDRDGMPINSYVKLLVQIVDDAALEVHQVKMKIDSPTRIVTPYGGRLEWTLPGRTKMIAHLKHKDKIRRKKRWSQVMYMYYLLGFRIMQRAISEDRKRVIAQSTYILALDGDIDFQPNAVHLLLSRMKVDPLLGAACGRIHPVGNGPMVWYQTFEYAIGHWLQKATEHVIGCVLCSPGCFSLFRGAALMENSVMKKYTTKSSEALHYVQYDQGEDRWLCTLLLKQKYRVEYSAASDAYTHAPEGFNEFYNQRRRWVPSTMANILDLLVDSKQIVKANSSISMLYIAYQLLLMVGTILGPGTIFLMMVGSLATVFGIPIGTSFLWNIVPLMSFMILCYFGEQKYQLMAAFVITAVYAMVMMAVVVGISMLMLEDGMLAPSSMFFLAVLGQILVAAVMHPQEFGAVKHGITYYITIPSMYMLLIIYSLFNMNDVSWGTRENPQPAGPPAVESKTSTAGEQGKNLTKSQRLLKYLGAGNQKDEEGGIDINLRGLFRCMLCTHPKDKSEAVHLLRLADELKAINKRLDDIEGRLLGEPSRSTKESPHEIIDLASTIASESTNPPDDFQPFFEEDKEEIPLLPDWLMDPDLKNGDVDSLTMAETKFWNDLIDKYLKPLELSEKEKKEVAEALVRLRDMVIMAVIMLNALFVLVIFLLQINQDTLHLKWPLQVKNTITYDMSTNEIQIVQEYMQLEPLGILFVVFFGIILGIQFMGMLKHRLGTISEILSEVSIDFSWAKKSPENISASTELKTKGVALARLLQRPEIQYDEDELDPETKDLHRRETVTKLIFQQKNQRDWSNLETNFKRRYYGEQELKMGRLSMRRETIMLLNNKRASERKEREVRRSMVMSRRVSECVQQEPFVRINNAGITESNVDDAVNVDKMNSTNRWAQDQTSYYAGEGDSISEGGILQPWTDYSLSPSPVVHHRRRPGFQQQPFRFESDEDEEGFGSTIQIVVDKNSESKREGIDNPSFYDGLYPSLTEHSHELEMEGRRRKGEKVHFEQEE